MAKDIIKDEDSELAQDFNFFSLMKFVFPSIFAFVFIALYQMVDGFFIQEFVGDLAIATVNLYLPILYLFIALGVMLGTGANAVIVKFVGEGKLKEAGKAFSNTLLFTLIIAIVLTVICLVFAEPIMRLCGATNGNIGYLRPYYMIMTTFSIAIMLSPNFSLKLTSKIDLPTKSAGTLNLDPRYEQYIQGAKDAGLDVGVYFFAQAINEQEAVEEAEFVLQHLNGRELEMPIVYDPETVLEDGARTTGVSREQFTKNAIAFCERIKEAGYQPMIYCNMLWQAFELDMSELTEYPIWYADYEPYPQTPYHFEIWQFTQKGSVDGIKGNVDINLQLIESEK